MTITIVVILVVLVLMTLALFFFLKKEVDNINQMSKVYFTLKAKEYTDSISRDSVEENNTIDEKKDIKEDNEKKESSLVYVEKKANYQIEDLLKMMKSIDKKFNLNNNIIINKFIDTYVNDDKEGYKRYKDLIEMKNYIKNIGIFDIITSDDPTLIDKIMNDLILIDEDIFNEFYSGKVEFDIEDFSNYLEYQIGKCDPTIYVYVGDSDANYDKIDKRIKTIYDENIYKGIKIVYLNKLYDFSL